MAELFTEPKDPCFGGYFITNRNFIGEIVETGLSDILMKVTQQNQHGEDVLVSYAVDVQDIKDNLVNLQLSFSKQKKQLAKSLTYMVKVCQEKNIKCLFFNKNS